MRAIPCPVSPAMLNKLVHEDLLTDKEIASRLGTTNRRVQSWRKRFAIETLPRWARNEVLPLKGTLKSLLVGSMLGDGRIVRQPHASYYTESHCGAQRGYLEWKAAHWGPWTEGVTDVPDKREYTQVRMRTSAHDSLNPWRDLFYERRDKGWKRLVPEIVDHVDTFALAIWYLDDGCAAWWPDISFGSDEKSRLIALTVFEKFGLQPRWQSRKGKTGEFHMEREDIAQRFLELIRPHVPPCMKYKLGPFGFQGPHHQVRVKLTRKVLEEMASARMPIRQIARELGVGATTVTRRLDDWGIPHERKKGRPAVRVTSLHDHQDSTAGKSR